MEFDINRVYTCVNADELKVGSKVIVAYNLGVLKNCVLGGIGNDVLQKVKSEFENARFVMGNGCSFPLAYLVSEPEEKKLKWTDLKIGDVIFEKGGSTQCMVTEIDTLDDKGLHIFAGHWFTSKELEDWEKVEE